MPSCGRTWRTCWTSNGCINRDKFAEYQGAENPMMLFTIAIGRSTKTTLVSAIAAACQYPTPSPIQSESQAASQAMTTMTTEGNPGISDDRILFGQSAAFSGPAQAMGNDTRLGIQSAFQEQNLAGGVHGRMLELSTLDDQYEPHLAYSNTPNLINTERVFASIGQVGTPTSRSASLLANAQGVPFIAPFTGAGFLREADLENAVNLRASYRQEAEEMETRLSEDLGITRIAVIYQNDSYGQSGLDGVIEALEKRHLEPVASWYYQRNSNAVKAAVFNIVEAHPEAVIMIGAYAPVAKTITLARENIDPVFLAVSFVGSNALVQELESAGAGVDVTQVVPLPNDPDVPAVAACRAALQALDSDSVPRFVTFEGHLAGPLAIVGLENCGRDLSRDCFLNARRNSGTIDLDGMTLQHGQGRNQGSDTVFVTIIGDDGRVERIRQQVYSLTANVQQIADERPALWEDILAGERNWQDLSVSTNYELFPAIGSSLDNQIYYIMTGRSDFRDGEPSASGTPSEEEYVRYWHLATLLEWTFSAHRSLLTVNLSSQDDPTLLASNDESFDTSAQQRMERRFIGANRQIMAGLQAEVDALVAQVWESSAAAAGRYAQAASNGRTMFLVIAIVEVVGTLLVAGYNCFRSSPSRRWVDFNSHTHVPENDR